MFQYQTSREELYHGRSQSEMRKQNLLLYPPELATAFVAEHEQGPNGGPALTAYLCPAKVWTIGFGHTRNVHKGDTITKNEAYDLLTNDLKITQEELAAIVHVPLSEGMFVALMSWLFNLGLTAAVRNSTLLKKLNANDIFGAAEELLKWNKGGGKVLPGLVSRRNAEYKLFLEGGGK